jgi:hypothetical protein
MVEEQKSGLTPVPLFYGRINVDPTKKMERNYIPLHFLS